MFYKEGPTANVSGGGSIVIFISEDSVYKLIFSSTSNFSEETGKPYCSSLEDIIKKNSDHEIQRISLDNKPAIKILPYTINIGSSTETVISSVYSLSSGLTALSIEIKTTDQTKVKIGNEIFDQILSTFKFLDTTRPLSLTPTAPSTITCTKDTDCPTSYFCDYGYNCKEAPLGPGCTKIYSGSQKCIKKCSVDNDCSSSMLCQIYEVPFGSDVVIGQKGCR